MKNYFFMVVCVVALAFFCNVVNAEDRTSLGVEFDSNKDKLPFKVSTNPDTYKYLTSNGYISAGPKLTVVRKYLFFEANAQTLISTPRMENIVFATDSMEINSAYLMSASLGVVVHESFTPYIGTAYSLEKTTFKGKYNASTSISATGDSKTTHIGVGVRSIIPIAKMLSIYGDGLYAWSDTKTDTETVVTNINTNQSASSKDSSSNHDSGFSIDAGFEFTPISSFTARALVGISRTKESGEPESQSISYTLGLFYNF